MRFPALVISGVFVLLLAACSKKVVPVTLPPLPPSVDVQEINFDYFHGKARVHLKDGKKDREVKATIRIRKDSVIWMSLGVMGVQGGKALINKDSITVLSTVDKEYYVFDYKDLSQRFNMHIDYYVIQSAMLGNLIKPKSVNDKIIKETSFNVLEQTQGTVLIKNFINSATTKIERVEMTEPNTNNSLTINYRNFQPVNEKSFAYNGIVNLLYKATAGLMNTTIEFEYTKAEVGDKELRFPFDIPRKYDRR